MSFFQSEGSVDPVPLRPLKRALLNAYGGFNDRRIKNMDKGQLFIVDGRTDGDHDARGYLFLWFCSMFVEAISPESVVVTMRGGVPDSTTVRGWIRKHGATTDEGRLQFEVSRDNVEKLGTLANTMEAIVAQGATYPVKAYKYVCPRTAHSLEHLQQILTEHWFG